MKKPVSGYKVDYPQKVVLDYYGECESNNTLDYDSYCEDCNTIVNNWIQDEMNLIRKQSWK